MSNDDKKAVMQATLQFYNALNEMLKGNPEPFKDLWSHADDATYMGANGGFHVGWKAVFADWKAQAEKSVSGKAEPSNIQVTVGLDMAMSQSYTKGEVKHADGTVEKVFIRESSVFRKEDRKWKMILHHADALPLWSRLFAKDE